jgi:hypothetical protein
MERKDLDRFMAWLAALVEYFPHTKVHCEALLPGYFAALRALPVCQLDALFAVVLQQCRFFPTVAELLALAALLRPTDPCARCPGGHGVHAGHTVGHYDLGPFCHSCDLDMPTPPGYRPPTRVPPRRQELPQQTATIPQEELAGLLADLYAAVDKRAAALEWPPGWPAVGYVSLLTAEAAAARRAALRQQAQALGQAPAP